MKTIIASADQKEVILRKLADKNNGILTNTQVLTLSTALNEEADDDIILSLQFRDLLLQQIDRFVIYGKMFSFPSFIDEILSFAKECILYHIDQNDLPSDNANEEELKQIVGIALTLPFSEKSYQKDIKFENVSLHYQFIKDSYHYDLFESLKSEYPYEAYPSNDPSVFVRYTLSPRQEAEAIAQEICKKGTPCNIILTCPTQLPLYESVLQRYNIPFTSLKEAKLLHIPLVFKSLVELGIHQDHSSFINALKYHAFPYSIDPDTLAFFQQTSTGCSLSEDIVSVETDLFQREVKQYHASFQHAKVYYDLIKEDLDSLLQCERNALLKNAFEILRKSPYLENKDEFQAAVKIRETIGEAMDLLKTDADILFFIRGIENIQASSQTSMSDFCTISDLTHPVLPQNTSYIVSCSGENYPGVPVRSGLFDEVYVEKISKYPSQKKRHEMYMSQLQWIENCATDELIYSHHTNDYQGREVQLAFDIENKYPVKETKWDLVSLIPNKEQIHELSSDTANALFQTSQKITGSISTIERYFACPYSYFILSGLKIRKKTVPSLDAASIGSIQHKILEESVNQKGKEYANITKEEVEDFVDPAFELLKKMHPREIAFVELSKQRLIDSMMISLSFLKDFEANTSFEPKECEYRFSEDITENVHLNGVIDRLDLYRSEMFRIIDYKSSIHSLSEAKVKAGAQLQLLTYLIIAKRKSGLKPAGAYYFSLKEEGYSVVAKKVSYNKLSETEWDEESETKRMFNQRRLSGWKFTDRDTELDASSTHIKNTRDIYDEQLAEECILSLYTFFHDALLQGNIALDPREDACVFCDYKSVCRFHGERRKSEPQVMEEVSLKGKGK